MVSDMKLWQKLAIAAAGLNPCCNGRWSLTWYKVVDFDVSMS